MSSFDQRHRNASAAQELIMKLSQAEFAAEPLLFLLPQSSDDRPAQGITHRARGRLAVPIEVAAGLRAGKMEFADHQVRRLAVSHLAGLCLDVDDNPQRAPEPVFEHDERS